MSENNYGALMLKSALDTSVDVTKIIAPGIYPVIADNASAPDSSAGLMMVVLTATSQKTTFQKESSSVVYSLINGKWKKPEPGDVGNFGTAAFCDATTSSTDTTLERVPTVGWMGNGTSIALPENSDLNTIIRLVATYGVANPGSAAKNFPINLPGVLRISHNSDGRTLQEYTTFNPVVKYERALYSSGTWSAWAAYYSENNKQPAIAFSFDIYGGSSGKTNFNSAPLGQTSYVYADATGAPPESAVVIDYWGGFTTQRVQIAVASSSGRTYTRVCVGTTWSSWDSIYSVKYKPPYPVTSVNGKTGDVTIPTPDLSPYATMNWANSRFLQGERLGAVGHVENGNVGSVPVAAPNGSVITKIWMQGNWIAIDYRPKQYLLNGTWYNAGVA